MNVFVYEAMTAGASWALCGASLPEGGLLSEGLAMLRAVTEDFAAIMDVQVWGLRDARLADFGLPREELLVRSGDEEKQQFERLANRCDWVLLIAPELNGVLEERALWLDETNARLLSPSGEFLKIASSKSRTAKWLAARGIPVPAQVSPFTQAFAGPLILKRDDGAGGLGMRLVHHRAEISTQEHDSEAYRLERFYPGLAASLAVLCGPSGNLPLQPCEQTLDPNTFEYLGGRTPLPPNLENRAKALALAAVAAMPGTTGYVGVDLILGENPDGSQDVVVEINPRLTTSYVGLRQVCRQNLAQAMLDVAQERPVELSFREERVEFRPDGSSM